MLLCGKQAEKVWFINFKTEQSDWLADTDEEIDEQELEAHYSYMAKIQEVPNADSDTDAEPLEQVHYDTDTNVFANNLQHFEQSESISNTCAVETGDSNVIPDSPDMCDNDIQNDQHDVECDDERVALANLIANLKLDVDDNKKIQKQLKKANATLTQELTECKSILAETSRTLGESNSIRDSCLVALQNKQTEFERYKAFNDRTVDYDKLERKLNETLGLLAQKDIDIQEGHHYEGSCHRRKQRLLRDQIALDDALAAPADRLKIGKCNLRLSSDVTSKEATLQVVYDVLKLTPFYKAFQVNADAPEIYMQEFWAFAYVHNRSVRFKMNNKKHIIDLDQFRYILQICPKVGNKKFVEPPLEKEILIFL
ncbi:hypothetical protein Tco_1178018, partial [Tanacetum coccineum]